MDDVLQPIRRTESVNGDGLDQEIYNVQLYRTYISTQRSIVGLRNIDNTTCYINAALQCLGSTVPLVNWLFSRTDQRKTCK